MSSQSATAYAEAIATRNLANARIRHASACCAQCDDVDAIADRFRISEIEAERKAATQRAIRSMLRS